MKNIKYLPTLIKRAWKNMLRLRNQSILMAAICFFSAFLAVFSTLLFNCASLLSTMTNLPYMDSYLLVRNAPDASPPVVNETGVTSAAMGLVSVLPSFEIVEEVIYSEERDIELKIKYITTKMEASEKDEGAFLFRLIPNTERHETFMRGERLLTKGRHLTAEDYRNESKYVIIDEELAKINNLDIGSKIADANDEEFEIVGLYKTVKVENGHSRARDMPQNYIFASSNSKAREKKDNRIRISYEDLYVRFSDGVSKKSIEGFLSYIEELGYTGGEDTSNGRGIVTTYSFISVEELNRQNNAGVYTVLRIALVSLVSVFLITIAAVYMFSSMIASSRRKEILLEKALGEKRGNIAGTVVLELVFVMIPSIALGIISCIYLARDYVKELFIHFASQMTPENMRSTSSIVIQTQQDVGKLVIRYTESTDIPVIAGVIFVALIAITSVCIYFRIRSILREKTISLMSERRY